MYRQGKHSRQQALAICSDALNGYMGEIAKAAENVTCKAEADQGSDVLSIIAYSDISPAHKRHSKGRATASADGT